MKWLVVLSVEVDRSPRHHRPLCFISINWLPVSECWVSLASHSQLDASVWVWVGWSWWECDSVQDVSLHSVFSRLSREGAARAAKGAEVINFARAQFNSGGYNETMAITQTGVKGMWLNSDIQQSYPPGGHGTLTDHSSTSRHLSMNKTPTVASLYTQWKHDWVCLCHVIETWWMGEGYVMAEKMWMSSTSAKLFPKVSVSARE